MDVIARLGLSIPLVQAPMAGTSTPALAAAVCDGGALGSIAIGAMDTGAATQAIADLRTRTDRPFNVNVFTHQPPQREATVEAAWLDALAPVFALQGATAPATLRPIYPTFDEDDAALALLLADPPAVVSFHFGLPAPGRLAALRVAGCLLLASVTSSAEAAAAERAGIDVLVAQGWEAGGHRGSFDPDAPDDRLGTVALTRLLVARGRLPVIAAGGIMDGHGIRAAVALGAIAAQLGTAFVACPESAASDAHRAALTGAGGRHTVMTRAISGRPARCVANAFTAWGAETTASAPAYPLAYDAGKALHAAASARGEHGYGAHWAGQGAPLARPLPAADLVALLAAEYRSGG